MTDSFSLKALFGLVGSLIFVISLPTKPEFDSRSLPLIIDVTAAALFERVDFLTHPFLRKKPIIEILQTSRSYNRNTHIRKPHVPLWVWESRSQLSVLGHRTFRKAQKDVTDHPYLSCGYAAGSTYCSRKLLQQNRSWNYF